MTSLRTALLAAAALAIAPTMAHAEDRGAHQQHAGDDPGPRAAPGGGGGQRGPGLFHGAPAAPVNGPSAAPPRGNWGGGQPGMQMRPQQTERGVWPGAGRWQGEHRDARPSMPTQNAGQAHYWQDRAQQNRGQWRGGDNRSDANAARADDHRRDGGDRRQWDGRQRDSRQWEGRQWDGRQWNNGARGPWPNQVQRDDRNRQHWNGGDYRRGSESRRGWDAGRWRNDNRYDWRGWRNSHRDLFRGHYYAPRGYHYRPVYSGFYLEPFFYGSSYWLSDPFDYRLPPVEWPLRWVRYYNDAVLVDVTSGEVVDVIQNFFW